MSTSSLLLSLFKYKAWANHELFAQLAAMDPVARPDERHTLAHVVTHGGYHRGAVGRVMAQVSLAPPRDTFTTYLHRAEPERRARG